MSHTVNTETKGWRWRKIVQYFLQGILVTAPVGLTIFIIYKFVSAVDGWITVIPGRDAGSNEVNRNYGSGFIVIIVALIIIGYLSSNFITSRLFNLFDSWLERTPGVKLIYSSIKDFFEAFVGNKRKFTRAVLINIHSPEVWQIGFITNDDAAELGLKDYITVYVPMSYSFAGITYIVPPSKVRAIEHISAGEALKYTISGGITNIEDEDEKLPNHH